MDVDVIDIFMLGSAQVEVMSQELIVLGLWILSTGNIHMCIVEQGIYAEMLSVSSMYKMNNLMIWFMLFVTRQSLNALRKN